MPASHAAGVPGLELGRGRSLGERRVRDRQVDRSERGRVLGALVEELPEAVDGRVPAAHVDRPRARVGGLRSGAGSARVFVYGLPVSGRSPYLRPSSGPPNSSQGIGSLDSFTHDVLLQLNWRCRFGGASPGEECDDARPVGPLVRPELEHVALELVGAVLVRTVVDEEVARG